MKNKIIIGFMLFLAITFTYDFSSYSSNINLNDYDYLDTNVSSNLSAENITIRSGEYSVEGTGFALNNAKFLKVSLSKTGNTIFTLLDANFNKVNSNGLVKIFMPVPKANVGKPIRVKRAGGDYITFAFQPNSNIITFAQEFDV